MKLKFDDFVWQLEVWSHQTFGTAEQRGPIGPLKHLAKEVQEVLKDPNDLMEYADCTFLLLDALERAGFTFPDLVGACFAKLALNKKRTWPKPVGDEPCEHVK